MNFEPFSCVHCPVSLSSRDPAQRAVPARTPKQRSPCSGIRRPFINDNPQAVATDWSLSRRGGALALGWIGVTPHSTDNALEPGSVGL